MRVITNANAFGYEMRTLNYGADNIDILAELIALQDEEEKSKFITLCQNGQLPYLILRTVLQSRFGMRGSQLFTLPSLKQLLTESAPDALTSRMYMHMLTYIFTQLGVLKEGKEVQMPYKVEHLIPTRDELDKWVDVYSVSQHTAEWMTPLRDIADKFYAAPAASIISECFRRMVQTLRMSGLYRDAVERVTSIIPDIVWRRPIDPHFLEMPRLEEIVHVFNFVAPALAKSANNGYGDYTPYHDEQRFDRVASFINNLPGKLKLISIQEIADQMTVLPVKSSNSHELRRVFMFPLIKDPKVEVKFLTYLDATSYFPETYFVKNIADEGGQHAQVYVSDLISRSLTTLKPDVFLSMAEQVAGVYVDNLPEDALLCDIKTFGQLTPESENLPIEYPEAYKHLNNLTTVLMGLSRCAEMDPTEGRMLYKGSLDEETILPPGVSEDIRVADKQLWVRHPSYLMLGAQRQVGSGIPISRSTPLDMVSSITLLQFPNEPNSTKDTKLKVGFPAMRGATEKDSTVELNLSEALNLTHWEPVFYFFNIDLVAHVRVCMDFMSWAIKQFSGQFYRSRIGLYAHGVVLQGSRSMLGRKLGYQALEKSGLATHSARSMDDIINRVVLRQASTQTLFALFTKSGESWRTITGETKDIRQMLYTTMMEEEDAR
jgi:hypothetical protein